MRNIRPRKLQAYRTSNGREPFTEWLISIHDRNTRNRIERRLDRIRSGNFGDYRSVGAGVFELRFSLMRVIASILVKWMTRSFCCSVGVTSHRKSGILNAQKGTGWNIRRHNDDENTEHGKKSLMERLAADKEKAIGYLDVALEEYQEDGDTPFFLLGLQNVIAARGGSRRRLLRKAGIEAQCPLEYAFK